MTNNPTELTAQLEEIQAGAANQVTLYESARTQLYKNLVGTYLWWREARNTEGYLEQLYAAEDIGFRKSASNRPNFHPLVRLVFKLQQQVEAMQISNWAHAIAALDDEYTAKPFIYKNRGNAVGELIDFIGDNGGVSGLRKLNNQQIEEFGDEVFEPTKQKKSPSQKAIEKKIKTQTQVLKHKKQQIAQSDNSKIIEIGEVATNEDELIVVLARRNDKSGKLTVIGSTADDDVINKTIMECAEIDLSTASPSLRVIAESLKPSVIPRQMQKRKLRKNFFSKTKIKLDDGEKPVEMREETRLVIKADNTILVSKIRSDASLTTIAYPTFNFDLKKDVFLRGSDRYFWEQNC